MTAKRAGFRTCPEDDNNAIKELIQKWAECEISYHRIEMLEPAVINGKIYRPVLRDDPGVKNLADGIAKYGLLEPLAITTDFVIISGHRRRMAASIAGLQMLPCRVFDIDSNDPIFPTLLIEFNNQRVKNNSELLLESMFQADPETSYRALIDYRIKQTEIRVETMQVGAGRRRSEISKAKQQMSQTVIRVVEDMRQYWPLSDRQIHYNLLNNPPLRNSQNKASLYRNEKKSYKDLTDLLTRLRLSNKIPMEAISDSTRPSIEWKVSDNVKEFAHEELDEFLNNYRRNLQRSQPNHLEIVGEKLTIEGIIRPVCAKYNIPYSIGRGYSSLSARWEIVKRFKKSGKDKLIIIILSDFDPEGLDLAESLLKSMRDDFGLNVQALRAGLSKYQVNRFKLQKNACEAKKNSARYKKYVARYGKDVFELESLTPLQMKQILIETIESVININAFNNELAAEKQDAAYIAAFRKQIIELSKDILLESGD